MPSQETRDSLTHPQRVRTPRFARHAAPVSNSRIVIPTPERMKNGSTILIIPHYFDPALRTRSSELARSLAPGRRVILLRWRAYVPHTGSIIAKLVSRLRTDLSNVFRRVRQTPVEGVIYLDAPVFQGAYFTRIGLGTLVQWINRVILGRVIRRLNADIIINSNDLLFSIDNSWCGTYIYDVVDDTVGEARTIVQRHAARVIAREGGKAARVTAISRTLCEKLGRHGLTVDYVPNGADLVRCRSVCPEAVSAIESRHQLKGKYVVSYIGNHTFFSGMNRLMAAFRGVRARVPEARLLIVGPVDAAASTELEEGCIVVGPVHPSEVAAYFAVSHLGVLPFDKLPVTDACIPLKILEYGAVRKSVVATRLHELSRLDLPHVTMVADDPDSWADAIIRARESKWNDEWDLVVEQFDWTSVARNLLGTETSVT